MNRLFATWLAVALSLVFCASAARADLVWDAETGTSGVQEGAGPAGTTWVHGGTNWWDTVAGANVAWDNASGATAGFGNSSSTTGYTVAVDAAGVTAGGLLFKRPYTLQGGPITLGGAAPVISVPNLGNRNITPHIGSALDSTATTLRVSGYATTSYYSLLYLDAINAYTGTLQLTDGGFVQVTTLGGLSAASTGTIVADTCGLILSAAGTYDVADLHLAGFGPGGFTSTNPSTSRGALRFSHSGSPAVWAGDIVLDAGSSICQNQTAAGQEATISGIISGGYSMLKTGAGELILTNQNTYTGGTTLFRGVLTLASPTGSPILPNISYVGGESKTLTFGYGDENPQLPSDFVVHFNPEVGSQYLDLRGHTVTLGGIDLMALASNSRGAIQNNLADTAGTLIVDNAANQTYRGIIRDSAGTLALVKRGAGTLTLDGRAHEFTGGLTVAEGTLVYGANTEKTSHYSPSIVVEEDAVLDVSAVTGFAISNAYTPGNAPQVLGGNGTVLGNLSVVAGNTIAPGRSIGSLSVTGDLSLGGTLDVQFDSDAETIDTLTVSGNLDLTGATLSFSDIGAGVLDGPPYIFATYGTLTGDPALAVGVPLGYEVDYHYAGKHVALVPEPSTMALLAILGLALAVRRRRQP